MIEVEARLVCGCCYALMSFKNEGSARAAFEKAGLGHVTVVDDAGTEHEMVDTFYGFWKPEEPRHGLGWLAARALEDGA